MAGQWESGRAVVRVWGQQLEAEAVGKGEGSGAWSGVQGRSREHRKGTTEGGGWGVVRRQGQKAKPAGTHGAGQEQETGTGTGTACFSTGRGPLPIPED